MIKKKKCQSTKMEKMVKNPNGRNKNRKIAKIEEKLKNRTKMIATDTNQKRKERRDIMQTHTYLKLCDKQRCKAQAIGANRQMQKGNILFAGKYSDEVRAGKLIYHGNEIEYSSEADCLEYSVRRQQLDLINLATSTVQ